jgi:branched-chain amino acid transport system ATP-binding protein
VSDPILRVDSLCAGYGQAEVLRNLSLHVAPGEIVALVGSNGAGKTTLLRALSGLVPFRGTVSFLGASLAGRSPERIFSAGLVHVPEGRQLFYAMTVEDNLKMGARLRKDAAAVAADFERVWNFFPRLKERRRQLAGSMSGGEQQMCAMARALMAQPRLLLVDEMSLGLAPVVVDRLLEILLEIRKAGMPVLLVEQDVFAAFSVADRGYVLETGHIVGEGPISELREDPRVRAAYLGEG